MNLGDVKAADAIAAVLQEDDDDAVDPHLERIKNEAGGDESDEEVSLVAAFFFFFLCLNYLKVHRFPINA